MSVNAAAPTEVIAKIKKLMALSESTNQNEAALAASKAQALMNEWKLTEAQLSDQVVEQLKPVGEHFVTDNIGQFSWMTWKAVLVHNIAKLNSCFTMRYDGGRRIKIIGREADRQVVEYLACYLMREIERLAFDDYKRSGFHGNGNKQRWTWVQSFGMGATHVVLDRMRQEKQAFTAQNEVACTALVKRDDKALENFFVAKYGKVLKDGKASCKINGEATRNGRAAGANIQWHSAINRAAASKQIQ